MKAKQMKVWRRSWAALAATVLLATACGGGDPAVEEPVYEEDVPPPISSETVILATTSILGDIARNVAGDRARVDVMMPVGTDPHDYVPSAELVNSIYRANLVLSTGYALEERMADVLDIALQEGVNLFKMGEEVLEGHEEAIGGDSHDEEAGEDAHDHEGEAAGEDSHDHEGEEAGEDSHDHEGEADHDDEADEGAHDHDEVGEDAHDHEGEADHDEEADEGAHDHDDEADEGAHDHDDEAGEDAHDHEGEGEDAHDHEGDEAGEDAHDHEGEGEDAHDHEGEEAGEDSHDHEGEEAGEDSHDHEGEEAGEDSHDHEGEEAGEDSHDHEGEEAGEDSHEEDGHAHAHDHGTTDPHFWMDPLLVAEGALALGEKLTPFDGSEEWMAAARAYAEQLTALDTEIREILAVVPPERRKLITGHDSFGYFAQRYGFEVLSTIIPSTHTLAEPGSAHLAELVGLMIEHDIPAIFVDIIDVDSPDLGEALAAEVGSGVRVVELYTGSLGAPGSGAETLISMLRVNAQRIAEALG